LLLLDDNPAPEDILTSQFNEIVAIFEVFPVEDKIRLTCDFMDPDHLACNIHDSQCIKSAFRIWETDSCLLAVRIWEDCKVNNQ